MEKNVRQKPLNNKVRTWLHQLYTMCQ